jgi:hypothetical protein
MALQDEIDQIELEDRQINSLKSIRQSIKKCYDSTTDMKMRVIAFQDQELFDNIPAETKAAFTRLYQIFNQARIACEADEAYSVLINPKPEQE